MTNIFGTHDTNTIEQFREVEKRAVRAALMSDGHFGYIMPVGGVAAYDNEVSVHGVGFDIACGNCAIKTDMHFSELGNKPDVMLERIASKIMHNISFGIGRKNKKDDAPVDHPLFDDPAWSIITKRASESTMHKLREKAQEQLGTVGSGNHYVDVFRDEDGMIWVGVHFGSRGLGHTIASGFLSLAQDKAWGERVPEAPAYFALDTEIGDDYWRLMNLAGEYAYAGREWVTRKVVEILGAKEIEMVHNHHNFAWKETHKISNIGDGFPVGELNHISTEEKELIVVRKGATPAFPGQKGFVGGSMGDVSVILEGANLNSLPEDYNRVAVERIPVRQQSALFSTVHGAGRVMSRTEAAGKRDRKTGKLKLNEDGTVKKPPRVTKEMMNEWLQREGVIVKGGGVDESPHVYRRLPEVLASQLGTVNVLHTLKPLIVCMAGPDTFDPYGD